MSAKQCDNEGIHVKLRHRLVNTYKDQFQTNHTIFSTGHLAFMPSDTAFCSYMVVRYTHYQRYKHHYVIKQKHTMQKAHISEISAS